MQIPPVKELEEAAKKLVWAAKEKGTLKEFTPRLIRQTIEKQLNLEEASLDASEYKSAIKSATRFAIEEDPPSEEEETLKPPAKKVNKKRKSDTKHEEYDKPTPKSKGKSSATASKDKEDDGSAKKKRKTVKAKKVDEKEENSDSEEASSTTTKKNKSKRKDTKQFKSLEHVPTSDMEQDEPGIINIAGSSDTKIDSPKEKKRSPLQKKTVPSKSSKESQNPESSPTDNQQSKVPDVAMKDVDGRDVSSELSELDEPKPKQKAKVVKEPKMTKTKEKEKEKKSAKSSSTLTKDEETIKRLKSLVLACGIRKVWSKVFQDLDSPSQQIKKLKEILAELGMTGRMSMDQAKTIKRKRELAQELEDVQQFEKAVLGRSSSRSRSQTSAKVAAIEEDDSEKEKGSGSEDEDEEEVVPKRRPNNARKSIMAFLQDQSDEE